MNHRKESYIVALWSTILKTLEKFSVFYFIRKYVFPSYTRGNYRIIDTWLIGHTILSIIYVLCANSETVPSIIKYILLIYGSLRVFEIFIYQLNVILVHPYNNSNYSLYSYRRMTIALIHNFFEIVFWFAGTYLILHFISEPESAIYNSFTHMVSYSMSIDEWSSIAFIILQFQALIGVFMTVLSLARFISLFPQPRSMDEKEQEANDHRYETI